MFDRTGRPENASPNGVVVKEFGDQVAFWITYGVIKPVIIYIMGVSGSGKTTIGVRLSRATAIPFFDADDLHTQANKEKMKAGHPLTDHDRSGWLAAINQLAKQQSLRDGAIIACSALKEDYRVTLSEGIWVPVHWILLQGSYRLIMMRMKARKGHFMPPSLLQSQFDTLEIPANALVFDIAKGPDDIVRDIMEKINGSGT